MDLNNDSEIQRHIKENRCETMVDAYRLGFDDGIRKAAETFKSELRRRVGL